MFHSEIVTLLMSQEHMTTFHAYTKKEKMFWGEQGVRAMLYLY